MLIRIIEFVHYICFICFSFFIILSIWDIFFLEDDSLRGYDKFFTLQGDDNWVAIFIWLYIFMPFIRYIIFGRLGWFPWTPFEKD